MNSTDHIQLVTFKLAGLDPDAYRAHCEDAAPAFAASPRTAAAHRRYCIAASAPMKVTTW